MKLVEMLRSELPDYSIKVPSVEDNLSFRPFLVKEEKNLLLVSEEGNELDIIRAIKNILIACFDNLNLDNISLGEAEYLFVKLRERSVGENLELIYSDGLSKKPVNLDLRTIKAPKRTGPKINTFSVTENITIKLRELTLNDVIKNEIKIWNKDQDTYIKMVASMIDTVTIKEESLSGTDLSHKEMVEFVESMTETQFAALLKYAEKSPQLHHALEVDGNKIEISGLNDFFGLVSPT